MVDFPYLFDLGHFKRSIQDACPQMKVYSHRDDLYDLPSTAKSLPLAPQDLSWEFEHGVVLAHLVSIRPDLRQPFCSNSHRFSLDLAPDEGIAPHAYMGAHLRTEADATAGGCTGYDIQAGLYIKQPLSPNLSTIYVASGNTGDIIGLRKQASMHAINVASKFDLLSGTDLEDLRALTWDQQALIDYEVLLRSSTFGGVPQSSFAWNIALRRNLLSSVKDYMEQVAKRSKMA
jgi:hypothetical protein